MSILIKGMEMPASCLSCPHHEHGTIHEWELYCGLTGDYIGHWDDKSLNNGHRLDTCPLVEVPPHGRLIDGDNVIKLLREQLTGDRDTVYEYYDDGLEMAISELSIVPTIIEAEGGAEE